MDCGKLLDGSNGTGPNAPKRCVTCNGRASARWTRESVIAAIQRWAAEHGGVPPTAKEWLKKHDGGYPYVATVQALFGSWREGIIAAGFDAFRAGCYGRDGEYDDVISEVVDLYRQGLSGVEIGSRMGVHPRTIYYRLEKAGVARRPRFHRAA